MNHYTPLPDNAREAIYQNLRKRGYDNSNFLSDFEFPTGNGQNFTVNTLVPGNSFGSILDLACWTILSLPDIDDDYTSSIFMGLAASTAPFHLIHKKEHFDWWACSHTGVELQPILIASEIPYNEIDDVFSRYENDITSERILDVKQGRSKFFSPIFQSVEPLQLSLIQFEVNENLLIEHFSVAANTIRSFVSNTRARNVDDLTAMLSLQILGAVILADTGTFDSAGDYALRSNRLDTSLETLIHRAHNKFGQFFDINLIEQYLPGAETAYNIFTRMRYSLFSPEMLSKIYKSAYPKEVRKSLGRYDTPLYLTRRIWETLPVEYLEPTKRITTDMTCGWGSFLISGYERLSRLSDNTEPLHNLLVGNDIDAFTAWLAKLALLVSTREDSWNIDHGDIKDWTWLHSVRPNIIVGNPPFGSRQEGDKVVRSSQILDTAMNRIDVGGYIGMVMPKSFLSSDNYLYVAEVRKKLKENFDIFELWELPEEVFDAKSGTVVIFAQRSIQKQTHIDFPKRIRVLQESGIKVFAQSVTTPFTQSSIVGDNFYIGEKNHISYNYILPRKDWAVIASECKPLREFVDVFKGADPSTHRQYDKDYGESIEVDFLERVHGVLRDFKVDLTATVKALYPDDFIYPVVRHKNQMLSAKVLSPTIDNARWSYILKAGVEYKGVLPTKGFYVFAPKENQSFAPLTLEVVAAILQWKISHAWIKENSKSQYKGISTLASLPVPFLTASDCETITANVNFIQSGWDASLKKRAFDVIDYTLKSAYKLDDKTYRKLTKIYHWAETQIISFDEQLDMEATWNVSGVVEKVNVDTDTIVVWLDALDDLLEIPIHSQMPGWMLREGVLFRAKTGRPFILRETNIPTWGTFEPQMYTYRDIEHLYEQIISGQDDNNDTKSAN